MKTSLLLIVSCVISQMTFAQKGVKDKAADKLLSMVSSRYKKFKTIKADFTYSLQSKMDNAQEKQKGTIYIKGNKFRLDISGQIIICDNSTVWTYSKEVNELQINHYNPKQATIRLDHILTMYDKGFIYRIMEEKKEGTRDISMVELSPKDKKKPYFKIVLTIDKTNQSIVKSMVYDKNSSIHSYTITNQFPNLKLVDKFFSFDESKFPGIEVIDLRK